MEAVGLIAGNGVFPILFAKAARARGHRVVAVGMRGETDPHLMEHVDALTWTRVGELGKLTRAFLQAEVKQVALAGGVDKQRLWGRARPDWTALRLLGRLAIRADDSLLRALAAHLESVNLKVIDSTHFLPEIMAPEGTLTRTTPSDAESRDIAYGVMLAREIGRLGVGQTVVVKHGAVLALEAIEGTDACIRRAGALSGSGGIVIKVAKPTQDMRFDVPAVGVDTLRVMSEAGLCILAVEAGKTLILGAEKFVDEANRRCIAVVGWNASKK